MDVIPCAFEELKAVGYASKNILNNEQAFRISRDAYGKWFIGKKIGYNQPCDRIYLKLDLLPYLKNVLAAIISLDAELSYSGGRIFLSRNHIYKKREGQVICIC